VLTGAEDRSRLAGWFFAFFFLSGLASLVNEVVTLRLAMASFGATTPLVSIVLSVFMGGLALGSWGAGRLAATARAADPGRALRLYAAAEFVIGLSALAIPAGFDVGRAWLVGAGDRVAWGSTGHYAFAAVAILIVLLPFTTAMGATFPLAMGALRGGGARSERSFSFLYLANVLGAGLGTLAAALVLIELLGLRGTLRVAGGVNLSLALAAWSVSARAATTSPPRPSAPPIGAAPDAPAPPPPAPAAALALLFITGFASMAMEVVWVRQYTPILGTVVYSFAAILGVYLFGTFAGSAFYRRWIRSRSPAEADAALGSWWWLAGVLAVVPLALTDPRLPIPGGPLDVIARVAFGIAPFSAAAGFLTPMLVDRAAAGHPARAGVAYAANVVGCILGPLAAGFLLLPALGERGALVGLAALVFSGAVIARRPAAGATPRNARRLAVATVTSAIAVAIVALTRDHETLYPRRETRRDYEATVIATGAGMDRQLLVNGVTMTNLTPITKMMVHLPLALLGRPPRSSVVVCFGMGTTFRSATSWGIPCTAVELIPSVPALFGFYHADASSVVARPGAEIVVDDGRRFLARGQRRYDLVTVDPPPPAEAATSGLLYSAEFCALARERLTDDGILALWFPGGDPAILSSICRAMAATFPYTRAFQSIEGWGFHLLASRRPIGLAPASALVARLPARAAADLVEWGPWPAPVDYFRVVLERELPFQRLIELAPSVPALTDDRPVNEYFLVRRGFAASAPR
jgi:spermidine synthase